MFLRDWQEDNSSSYMLVTIYPRRWVKKSANEHSLEEKVGLPNHASTEKEQQPRQPLIQTPQQTYRGETHSSLS